MAPIIRFNCDRHAATRLLLPWYLTGRLEAGERARLEAHLRECPECQAELREEERLDFAVGALQLDVEHGWAEMRGRLRAKDGWRTRATAALRAAFGGGGLAWTLAGQLALVLTATLLVVTFSQHEYHTLGSPPPDHAGNVLVVFRPETPEGELRAILKAGEARVVDGPTSAGAYVLSVRPAARPASLAALRGRPQVLMAEPIDPDEGP